MSAFDPMGLSRRGLIAAGAAAFGTGLAPLRAQEAVPDETEVEPEITSAVRRNISSFRSLDWRPYFNNTTNGAVLVIDRRLDPIGSDTCGSEGRGAKLEAHSSHERAQP